MIINVGRHDFSKQYLCIRCEHKEPKFNELTGQISDIKFCPKCGTRMRGKAHNPAHKKRLELMGLVKRY